MNFSIVLPCYNEEKNIPLILERFKAVIKNDDIEVILVNNGSTDNSQEVLNNLLPKYQFAKTTLVSINNGYGNGILKGLEAASGQYIGWTHADLQTDPGDVIRAFEIIKERNFPENIFVKGTRKGRSLFDEFFTVGMSLFESVYLNERLYDINAQPNIFHRSFYENFYNPPLDFSLDLYALYMARRNKLDIIRFEVLFPKRIYGFSNWNTGLYSKWKFIKRTIDFSVKLKERKIKNDLYKPQS